MSQILIQLTQNKKRLIYKNTLETSGELQVFLGYTAERTVKYLHDSNDMKCHQWYEILTWNTTWP